MKTIIFLALSIFTSALAQATEPKVYFDCYHAIDQAQIAGFSSEDWTLAERRDVGFLSSVPDHESVPYPTMVSRRFVESGPRQFGIYLLTPEGLRFFDLLPLLNKGLDKNGDIHVRIEEPAALIGTYVSSCSAKARLALEAKSRDNANDLLNANCSSAAVFYIRKNDNSSSPESLPLVASELENWNELSRRIIAGELLNAIDLRLGRRYAEYKLRGIEPSKEAFLKAIDACTRVTEDPELIEAARNTISEYLARTKALVLGTP